MGGVRRRDAAQSQKRAHKCLEDQFVSEDVWPLSDSDRAMSRSQRGPFAAAFFVVLPTSRFSKFDPHVFRVLLRRRLRFPLPLSSRSCRMFRGRGVWETWVHSGKGNRTSLS